MVQVEYGRSIPANYGQMIPASYGQLIPAKHGQLIPATYRRSFRAEYSHPARLPGYPGNRKDAVQPGRGASVAARKYRHLRACWGASGMINRQLRHLHKIFCSARRQSHELHAYLHFHILLCSGVTLVLRSVLKDRTEFGCRC